MKKHHWHAFWHEKLFEKHPQLHCQTNSKYNNFFKKTLQPSSTAMIARVR